MNQILTEKDLLRDFEKYNKIIQELESIYTILPPEAPGEAETPNYVSEASFSYQIHSTI